MRPIQAAPATSSPPTPSLSTFQALQREVDRLERQLANETTQVKLLRDESDHYAILATQRGARMQIMWQAIAWETWFPGVVNYHRMATWFDKDGVPK